MFGLFRMVIRSLLLLLTGLGVALAHPDGAQIVNGQVGFAHPDPATLNITNSPGAIINWQQFSIQQNEITRFVQQSTGSAVLNRVVSQVPSDILGQLLSNGRVFLINPNGIVFGQDAVIDTAGLIASTLDMSDEDFINENLKFQGSNAADIQNRGYIKAGANGDIFLIAPNIENSGIIETEGGQIILVAGESITIASLASDHIVFDVQAPDNEVVNLGEVITHGGAAKMFAGTIKHSGSINADSISLDSQGLVVLRAIDDIELRSGSLISVSGNEEVDAGTVSIEAHNTASDNNGTVYLQGEISAEGKTGGHVSIVSDSLLADGLISVDGEVAAGDVNIHSQKRALVTANARLSADSATGKGGTIKQEADESLFSSGSYSAMGDTGGRVELLGDAVKLADAEVDVSGRVQGGDIRVGGGFQGEEAGVTNASNTQVNGTVTLNADAIETGDGGTVVVWADGQSRFSGITIADDVLARGSAVVLVAGTDGSGDLIVDVDASILDADANDGNLQIHAGTSPANIDNMILSGENVLLDGASIGTSPLEVLLRGTGSMTIIATGGDITLNADQAGVSARAPEGTQIINAAAGLILNGGVNLAGDSLLQAQSGQDIDALFIDVIGSAGDAIINNVSALQNINTTGKNVVNINEGILLDATGAGAVAIRSEGTQDISVLDSDLVRVVGTVGNADISSVGTQVLSVTGSGGNRIEVGRIAAAGESRIVGNQTITAGTGAQTGSIFLQAGSGVNARARISSTGTPQTLATTGSLTLLGGSGNGAIASIDGASVIDIDVGGLVLLRGGQNTDTGALIGSDSGGVTVTLGKNAAVGGTIRVEGGNNVGGTATIGSICVAGPCPATVVINGSSDVSFETTFLGGEALIGSLTQDSGSVVVKAGLAGGFNTLYGGGRILADGPITLEALIGNSAIGFGGVIDAGLGALTATAQNSLALREISGGTLNLKSNTYNVDVNSNNTTIQARAVGLAAATPAITIEAPQGSIDLDLDSVPADGMTTVSGGIVISARDDIDLDAGDDDVRYSTPGDIIVTSTNSFIESTASAELLGRNVTLSAAGFIETDEDITATGFVDINAITGTVTVGNINAVQNINVDAGSDVRLSGAVTSDGIITVTSTNNDVRLWSSTGIFQSDKVGLAAGQFAIDIQALAPGGRIENRANFLTASGPMLR